MAKPSGPIDVAKVEKDGFQKEAAAAISKPLTDDDLDDILSKCDKNT